MSRSFRRERRRFLATLAGTIGGLELTMLDFPKSLVGGVKTADDPLSALRGASAWLNSPPLTAADLRGKVVLIEFWTYTCINWLRQLPYVRAWARGYREHGLVVIGVHTPEFGFERDLANVRRAAADLEVDYPIAVDSDYAIWRGFGNRYWPALYFVDARGTVRHRRFGEGRYQESERMIRRLLREAGSRATGRELATVLATGVEAAADWGSLRSPESYLGSDRGVRFVSTRPAGTAPGHGFAAPPRVGVNEWALAGDWTRGREAVALHAAPGRIVTGFHARDLHLVMGPAPRRGPVRYRVRLEGRPPGEAHGIDVDPAGQGLVTDQRLYQLIRQPKPIEDRRFEIEFLDAGVEAFAFTFG